MIHSRSLSIVKKKISRDEIQQCDKEPRRKGGWRRMGKGKEHGDSTFVTRTNERQSLDRWSSLQCHRPSGNINLFLAKCLPVPLGFELKRGRGKRKREKEGNVLAIPRINDHRLFRGVRVERSPRTIINPVRPAGTTFLPLSCVPFLRSQHAYPVINNCE